MDSRQRNWSDLFGAPRGGEPLVSVEFTPPPISTFSSPSFPANLTPPEKLEELWARSQALREHALQVRAVSMEARAIARDVRLRNQTR
jgi:hypothetical protein